MIPILFVVIAVAVALLSARSVPWWMAALFFILGFLTAGTTAAGPISQIIHTVTGVFS
ncbi:hydrophobic protein [Streptomyces sp. NPDC041068]|uniref:hydrophobic protein n=1 Tax=Streptomyces sp. NPDC041068 TaxID=3155130 RepID=UPI003409072D